MGNYRYLAAAFMALAYSCSAGAQNLTSNSQFFSVQDYFYLDHHGNYRPYKAAGFAEQSVPTSPRLLILPTITIAKSNVKYYAASGQSFDPVLFPNRPIESVSVQATYSNALPTEAQMPGIAASLKGQTHPFYLAPPLKDTNGNLVMLQQVQNLPDVVAAIRSAYQNYETTLAPQNDLIAHYRTFSAQSVQMNELKLSLVIDGDEVASRKLTGTGGTTLPAVTLVSPTPYQNGKIQDGAFELVVSFRFPDSNAASIQADLDRSALVRSFLKETQEAITKKKSSGWQVFHIGSRRSKISQSINSNVSSSFTGEYINNTRIVMRDATDQMIEAFESKFFPQLSQQNAIANHLSAATVAESDGKPELAKIHRDYAAALTNSDEMKEVDAVGAAAALNEGDYATFVAKGVRASSTNNVQANSFRRVVSDDQEIKTVQGWDDTRIVTVQRETSVPVQLEDSIPQKARFGICNAVFGPMPVSLPTGPYGQLVQLRGMMPTCMVASSPFAAANLVPGSVVTAINGNPVTSMTDFNSVLASINPGDSASVRYFDPQSNREATVNVEAKYGVP